MPSATGALVFGTIRVHRIPRPTFVTIAKRPFVLGGDGKAYTSDLGILKIRIFLQAGLDSQIGDLPPGLDQAFLS